APSGPAVMPPSKVLALGIGNSAITPAVVMRPIWLLPFSMNHSAPSGPVVMREGALPAVGIVNSTVNTPAALIRPILLTAGSVNHIAPSGPVVIPSGGVESRPSVRVTASACWARPTTAHDKMVIAGSRRRYRFHIVVPRRLPARRAASSVGVRSLDRP